MSHVGVSGKARQQKERQHAGRFQALTLLDQLLAEEKSQAELKAALAEELHANPLRFFRTVIMPLLPRDAKLPVISDGIVEWHSLLGETITVATVTKKQEEV